MKAQQTARIAFVGAGNHATQSLYPNIPMIPEFELVAVCDLVGDKAREAARRYGASEWFTDVETLLDRVRPQGVCVCGPGPVHHSVGLQVLRRGIPVFMEKPPGHALADAQALAEAARGAGVWGMVGFMKRFAPANVVAKEYMTKDEFGRLTSINLIHGSGPYDDMRRMLLYNGIHMLDLARFLGGDVADLSAHGFNAGPGAQAVSVAMRFANGAVGQFNMNSGRDWSDCFEQTYISGSKASMLIDASRAVEVMSPARRLAKGEGLSLYGWSGRYYVSGNMAGWTSGGHYTRGYWGELSHFARAVLGQAVPTPTLDDGVEALRLVERVMEQVQSPKRKD